MFRDWQTYDRQTSVKDVAADKFEEIGIADQFDDGQYSVEVYDEYTVDKEPVYAPCGHRACVVGFFAEGENSCGDKVVVVYSTEEYRKVVVRPRARTHTLAERQNAGGFDDIWPPQVPG